MQTSGSFTVDLELGRIADRLAELVAARLATALAEDVAAKAADVLLEELAPVTAQGWHAEMVRPAWSGHCWLGEHHRCDGTAPPAESGCHCPHHRGEPIGRYVYVPPSTPGEVPQLHEQGSADPGYVRDEEPGPDPGHRRGIDPPDIGDVTGEVGR